MRLFLTTTIVAFTALPAGLTTFSPDGPEADVGQPSLDYSIEEGIYLDSGGNVQQVVREADIVVLTRAGASAMRFGAQRDPELGSKPRRLIFQDYAFEPLRVIKGTLAAEGKFTVAVQGGKSVNGVALPLADATFVEGRQYVLLVCAAPGGDGLYWLTRGESSAFDVTDARVAPLGNSVSARSQQNASTDRFLQLVVSAAKQKSTKKEMGYTCGSW